MGNSCGFPAAAALIRGAAGLWGTVKFYPRSHAVLVVAEINGLPASETGFYGLHIHEGPDCEGAGYPNTGSHYNPAGAPHPCHAGDLPPLLCCGRRAYMSVLTDRFRIRDVVGRTVVIHSGRDDFTTQPAGNSGQKIGCGVIRWQ